MKTLATGTRVNCWRCNATGRIPEFSHIANGVCFACNGDGSLDAGKPTTREGVHSFVIGKTVWQFNPIHHGEDAHYTAQPGQSVDSVMVQSFALGASRRTGTTELRARVDPDVARELWKLAQSELTATEIADAKLSDIRGTCAMSENFRGIDLW